MRKRVVKIWDVPAGEMFPGLLAVSAGFALGALAGLILAAEVRGPGRDSLSLYLERYLAALCTGAAAPPGLWSVLRETCRWPLAAFLMGFTALGLLGIPVLCAIRGFLLSFAAASLIRLYGGTGLALAFSAFGFAGLMSLPVLFVLGVQGFTSARDLAVRVWQGGKGPLPFGRARIRRWGICAVVLVLCTGLEYWIVPALLRSVSQLF